MLSGNVAAFFAPLAFVVACHYWYIPFEEAALRRKFGASFERYSGKTRRWF